MMELVAAGAEELNASVREISAAMSKSRDTALTAVEQVESADLQAQRLSEAAESMSSIVQLIGDITGQINLLALNATIESARAGEAGRGFAVVASEVKNLANQAKQATDKIEQEIGNLNGISGDVVGALDSIKKAIQEVSEYVTSTAAAVEEQSTVTSEMSTACSRPRPKPPASGRRRRLREQSVGWAKTVRTYAHHENGPGLVALRTIPEYGAAYIGRTSTTSGTKCFSRFWMPCCSVAVDDGQPAQEPFMLR